MKIEVVRFERALEDCWDKVLASAKNGIFLFERRYMEYHRDRFPDMSCIAFVEGAPAMLLPATCPAGSDHVTSHGGLTFGGFVVDRALRSDVAIAAIEATLDQLAAWGMKSFTVRALPWPFWTYPSGEMDYCLWRRGFNVVRRDLSSLVPLSGETLAISSNKRRDAARAAKLGVEVREGPVEDVYQIIREVLESRHQTAPVHSLDELKHLQGLFPDRILVRCAYQDGSPLAGAVIYRYDRLWHTQYLGCSDAGRKLNALDAVIVAMIEEARTQAPFFSFGTSTTNAGTELNAGLLWQKESFGARAIVHDFFEGTL